MSIEDESPYSLICQLQKHPACRILWFTSSISIQTNILSRKIDIFRLAPPLYTRYLSNSWQFWTVPEVGSQYALLQFVSFGTTQSVFCNFLDPSAILQAWQKQKSLVLGWHHHYKRVVKFLGQNLYLTHEKSKMVAIGFQNGQQSLERGQFLGFWMVQTSFAKDIFFIWRVLLWETLTSEEKKGIKREIGAQTGSAIVTPPDVGFFSSFAGNPILDY